MDKFCIENQAEILELAQAMIMRLDSNPKNAMKTFNMIADIIDKYGSNPFDGGRFTHRTSDEKHSLVHLPQPNGINNMVLCKTRDVINADIQADTIAREKRKATRKKINAVSGYLPRKKGSISCIWHMAEGERLDNSLGNPTYEGAHVHVLLLEACNMDFAIGDDVIKDVGIPPTLFLIRSEKTTNTTELNGKLITEEVVKVKRVYARCIDQTGYINGRIKTYDWPWCNCAPNSNGWLCLGENYQSGSLVFHDIQSLIDVPKLIISKFPSTDHYGTRFAQQLEMTYDKLKSYMKEHQGKPFNITHLRDTGEDLDTWLNNFEASAYR